MTEFLHDSLDLLKQLKHSSIMNKLNKEKEGANYQRSSRG